MAILKLWLDDLRHPPGPDWTWVKTVEQAKNLIQDGKFEIWEQASLDYSLDIYDTASDSVPFAKWMARNNCWPRNKPTVHSTHPDCDRLIAVIERYWPRRKT